MSTTKVTFISVVGISLAKSLLEPGGSSGNLVAAPFPDHGHGGGGARRQLDFVALALPEPRVPLRLAFGVDPARSLPQITLTGKRELSPYWLTEICYANSTHRGSRLADSSDTGCVRLCYTGRSTSSEPVGISLARNGSWREAHDGAGALRKRLPLPPGHQPCVILRPLPPQAEPT